MTSKTLFAKLLKDECKKNLWFFICMCIIFLFVKPIYVLIQIDQMLANTMLTLTDVKNCAINLVDASSISNSVIPIIFAVTLAFMLFSYLFSAKKVNLYHSLPIKRERNFFINYLSGICLFLPVFFAASILEIITICAKGFFSWELIVNALRSFVIALVYFLAVYHTAILAVMLTGNILVCLAACLTFLFYSSLIFGLLEAYFTNYLATYYPHTAPAAFFLTSPVLSEFYCFGGYGAYEVNTVLMVLCTFVISMLILALSVYLYKKRASESCGKALAFPRIAPVVRILFVIPAAMAGGLYINYLSDNLSSFWFWFAVISAGIIMHCIMEIIFHLDFKAAFKDKIQLLVSLALACLIALCFQYDWMAYDSYLPKEDLIASSSICFSTIDRDLDYYRFSDKTDLPLYTPRTDFMLDHISLSDTETIYSLASIAISQSDGVEKNYEAFNHYHYNYDEEITEPMNYFIIKYNLKSGREIYRAYRATLSSTYTQTAKIYDSQEYKEAAYQLDDFIEKDLITSVQGNNAWGNTVLSLRDDQMREFLAAYEKDFAALTFETINTTSPVISLSFYYDTNSNYYGYYIYPSFTRSMALLQSYGVSAEDIITSLEPSKIEWISASSWNDDLGISAEITYQANKPQDADKVAELGKLMDVGTFSDCNPSCMDVENNTSFEISYQVSPGMTKSVYGTIAPNKIPSYVTEDLSKQYEPFQK